MGLFDDVFSTFDSAVSGIFGSSGSFLGGSDQLNGGGSSFLPVTYQPYQTQTFQNPVTYDQPPMAIPVSSGGRALMAVPKWAMSFPSLWQALQRLFANYHVNLSPDKLYAMLQKYGPAVLAGLIGNAAISELMVYKSTHRRRRMNVANTKALRRSLRRLKGFDRLSHRVSAQLHRGSRKKTVLHKGSSGSQFIRQG